MKYSVTFSCGHTHEVELFGKTADRERKIAYFEQYGICPECYKAKLNKSKAEGCEEVKMHYGEYKKNYSDCKTKTGNYNKEEKTIIVYVPKKEARNEK